MPKIGVVRTTLNGEKNEDGLMAAILIFKCTEGAGVGIAVVRDRGDHFKVVGLKNHPNTKKH